ncbi:MAG: hypothetical protein EOM05_08555 [Clostridia bacterium]|nr:hypothetical protein [Clostridia bacterium]
MSKTRNVKRTILSMLAAVLMILAVVAPQMAFAVTDSEQEEIDRINNKIEAIEDEILASENKIAAIEEKKAQSKQTASDLLTQVNELDRQISSFNQKISLLNQTVEALNTQIKQTQENVATQEQEIEQTKALLMQRLRTMYMAGETSSIEILMSSDSFESFLTRMELVKSVSKHDSDLVKELEIKINELTELEKTLRGQQVKVQSEKDELSAAKAELVPKKKQLSVKVLEMNKQISSLNAQDAEAKKIQQNLEAQKDAFETEVDDILSGKVQNGSGSVGEMIWPLPYRGTYITSKYGSRTMNGVTKFHYGVDISTKISSPSLVAVADGTVVIASNNGSWNGGYGNYLAIDHGNGVVTVYGHCAYLKVTLGQHVTQGQSVAVMGSTGNSTGPHVHFEVRVNGSKKNPLNYLAMPSDVYYK